MSSLVSQGHESRWCERARLPAGGSWGLKGPHAVRYHRWPTHSPCGRVRPPAARSQPFAAASSGAPCSCASFCSPASRAARSRAPTPRQALLQVLRRRPGLSPWSLLSAGCGKGWPDEVEILVSPWPLAGCLKGAVSPQVTHTGGASLANGAPQWHRRKGTPASPVTLRAIHGRGGGVCPPMPSSLSARAVQGSGGRSGPGEKQA